MDYTPNRDKTKTKTKRRRAGLYVLQYVMAALVDRQITPRAAILLAHVDKTSNSYEKRHQEGDNGTITPRRFRTDYLRQILHCNDAAVRRTIENLRTKRLLKARKLNLRCWEIKTRQRETKDEAGALYIHPVLLELFQSGKLSSPMGMLALAYISSYTRRNQVFYASNKHLGETLGVGRQRAQRIVKELEEDGWIRSKKMTRAEARRYYLFARIGDSTTDSEKTLRILTPNIKQLCCQYHDDDEEEDDDVESW